ncbi:Trypsin [Aquimixticola soesokkakensis]|uniref:Trypsin n=1 Tax=Aquimixticola soesokkakensis TaxID=1519096 RepID=A0A1Y5SZR8_9RHOB|nr:trypsin-like serine protease [Aquimixticola soesokkakensis]SLN52449.1 Trypsin [Aquimixticola soesokkakensis]
MRRLLTALFLIGLTGAQGISTPAQADTALKQFRTGVDSAGWEAVGRLDFAGRSFCTGAMITPTLVLTAAHCLYDIDSGRAHRPQDVTFRAGLRDGHSQALRSVRRLVAHPGYRHTGGSKSDRLTNDIALIELDTAVTDRSVVPFPTSLRPEKGDTVGVVSYAHDRANAPSLQESCHILARQGGVLVTSCEVDYGSSGAPIFSMRGGRAQIVSIVSAMAEFKGQKVSVGTAVDGSLDDLLAYAASGRKTFKKADASDVLAEFSNTRFLQAVLPN